ncbi:MAG: heparinase II/III family protein [Chitinophagaceae bacterium]|nr:heparinase II/III family protein [Chitinophagaceae bacterium]
MKYKFLVAFFLMIVPVLLIGQVQIFRNYLTNTFKEKRFSFSAPGLQQWRSVGKKELLQKISSLPAEVKQDVIKEADRWLSYDWPALPASIYMEFKLNGNRNRFEERQTERRKVLSDLVAAFLISKDQKYFFPIVNGLWATLEESTWVLPAHIGVQKAGSGLPDPSEQIIDLVNGQTAALLANIQWVLHDEMDAYSPIINERIYSELRKRIVIPYLQRSDFWWMGFNGNIVNNWNPWINTNVLHTELLTEANIDTLNLIIEKILRSTDQFINGYPEDGGCDEGPTYWSEAGGKLIRMLYLLRSVSYSKLNWSSEGLLQRMGTYIYKMQISKNYFVNFGDAFARNIPNAVSVYRFGEYFNNDSLIHFASYLFSLEKRLPADNITEFFQMVEVYRFLSSDQDAAAPMPAFSCLPDLQVITARSKNRTDEGLFLAIQGGNNGESHNHNDVGNFIIYANGKPVIVDAGVGVYTAQTFSSKRYELWNMQSQWHNCPTINGVMQQNGKQFKATGFSCGDPKNGNMSAKMDIAGAYPKEAAVKSWIREFSFDRDKNVISIKENYRLEKWIENSKVHFLACCPVKDDGNGMIEFLDADGKPALLMHIPKGIEFVVEEKRVEDKRLNSSWGDKLYRVTVILSGKSLGDSLKFEFSIPKNQQR